MAHFIDADKLIAEIERQRDYYDKKEQDAWDNSDYGDEDALYYQGKRQLCQTLLSFIDSLQQEPEVDLKKEIKEWTDLMVGASFPGQDGDFISEEDYRSVIRQTAIHFLGLNARKQE